MAHIVTKCSCGTVISSMIVCFGIDAIESSTAIVEKGCKKCKEGETMPSEHAQISYVKSGLRIIGYCCFFFSARQHPSLIGVAIFLIGAEIVGIIEEFGH